MLWALVLAGLAGRLGLVEGSFEEALDEARERRAPLLVLCLLEGEEASERFRKALLRDDALADAVAAAVVVLVNDGAHDTVTWAETGPDGERIERRGCGAYETSSCLAHQRNWDEVYRRFVLAEDGGDGAWRLPEALVLRPDGSLAERFSDGQPPSGAAMASALARVAREAGPALARADWTEARRLAALARGQSARGEWPRAWLGWGSVLERARAGPLADEAEGARVAALEGARRRVGELAPRLVAGSLRETWTELRGLRSAFAGSALEREISALRDEAERDASVRDALRALDRELDAEELAATIERLAREGDERRARALERRLLREFPETAAARRLRGE